MSAGPGSDAWPLTEVCQVIRGRVRVCVKGEKKAPGAAKLEVACSSHKWVKGRGDQVKPKAPFSSRATRRKVIRGGACGAHSKRRKGD